MVATTTCAYYNPVGASFASTTNPTDPFQFASSTCVTTYENSTTSSPLPDILRTRDSGDIVFSLAVLILIGAFFLWRAIVNTLSKTSRN